MVALVRDAQVLKTREAVAFVRARRSQRHRTRRSTYDSRKESKVVQRGCTQLTGGMVALVRDAQVLKTQEVVAFVGARRS